jgi:hypothetical protein
VVESAEPFQSTVELGRKPEPLTVRVNAGPPAVTELGLSPEIIGFGGMKGLTVKVSPLEVTPPVSRTVTLALPGAAIRLAATAAVSCAALTKVVGTAEPFHCTTEPERKPVPFTVRVKAAPPAATEFGLRLVMASVWAAGTVVSDPDISAPFGPSPFRTHPGAVGAPSWHPPAASPTIGTVPPASVNCPANAISRLSPSIVPKANEEKVGVSATTPIPNTVFESVADVQTHPFAGHEIAGAPGELAMDQEIKECVSLLYVEASREGTTAHEGHIFQVPGDTAAAGLSSQVSSEKQRTGKKSGTGKA